MPMGESSLSATLLNKLASPVVSELGRLYGMKDDVEKLQRTLKRLNAMLNDAEETKLEGVRFTLWLQELKNAAYDAEDVVDEFEYTDLRRQVRHSHQGRRKFSSFLRNISYILSPHEVSFRREMAHRIDDIWRRLDEISKNKDSLGIGDLAVSQPESKSQVKETSSFLADPEVCGRDDVKNKLIRLLMGTTDGGSSSSVHPTNLSVISVVGMGGLGKTTLAQCVYNTKEVHEHFHLRMWVYVSPDFDLKRVTKQILEHVVTKEILEHSVATTPCVQDIDNLDVLQQCLSKRLKGKRFLLVLDDVWEEAYTKWCELSAPLVHGERGSKILVTTRNANVVNTVRSEEIQLEGLSFDDCWSIFRKHAFPDGESDKYPVLESIGKEIVKKLKGVPLAVATLGSLLRFELEEGNWRNVLQSELWELEQDGEGIFPALKLSYEYLPQHLKPCFAYCSVFHKGCRFDMLELVQLWMAQGYVRPQGRKSMENVGRDYLNELFNRSLLLFTDGKYVIHDLLHDLGQHILQHDFYKIGPDQVYKVPEDAHFKRHLRLHYGKSLWGELKVLHNFSSLRTLLVLVKPGNKDECLVPLKPFDSLKCLRVLDLSYCYIETLPDSIGYLKHLRYFDLRKTPIKCLPESLCALYKLQTLKLGGCDQLNMLPKGMSNLVSLHYLEATYELVSKIAKIGKLIHLQNLEVFSFSNENENRIWDLKNLNELRGKLCIQNLHRVVTKEEAIEATLKSKQHLEVLEMEWDDDRGVDEINKELEESIIEGLQPPPHLKELTVKGYAGINCPRWMKNSSIPSLESFHIHRCINFNILPTFQCLNLLKALDITNCPQIKELPHLPTKLMNLTIQGVGLDALPSDLHDLPLEQLVICQIPELRELPLLPATLKELTVESVGLKALPEFCQCHELKSPTSGAGDDSRSPLLSILKIHSCPNLTSLDKSLLRCHMSHLQVLSIKDCKEVVSWPKDEGFRATLSSLEGELTVEKCGELEAFPEGSGLHPSLKKLVVKACNKVLNNSFFKQMHEFSSSDLFFEKWYCSLGLCVDEALQHIQVVDWLEIEYFQDNRGLGTSAEQEESLQPSSLLVSFALDRQETRSWEQQSLFLSQHVSLGIQGRRRRRGRQAGDVDDGATLEDESSKLLYSCLGGHVWTSSLRQLTLGGIPERAFFGFRHIHCRNEVGDAKALMHYPLHLPSLEKLCIFRCMEMRRLPTEMLLSHLPALKVLSISSCPELTLSSVEEGIQSLPSLQRLEIFMCPKMLMLSLSPLVNNGGSEDSISAPPPPAPLPLLLPQLESLLIDDAKLLTQLLINCSDHHGQNTSRNDNGRRFRDHLVNSLRALFIFQSELMFFMAEEEEGLKTLASSLQCLAFKDCSNLLYLPLFLGDVLPNLKVLDIENCPRILCLPGGGLPASLEILCIRGCPTLAERCRPRQHRPWKGGAEEYGDWHKMTHIPVIEIDGEYVRGSFTRFQELKVKWDFHC